MTAVLVLKLRSIANRNLDSQVQPLHILYYAVRSKHTYHKYENSRYIRYLQLVSCTDEEAGLGAQPHNGGRR